MLEIFTLGRVDLRAAPADAEATARQLLRQPKAFALLVYLAASESFIRRDRVAAMFWPDLDEAHARNALSRTLRRVADAVGRDVIVTRGAGEIGVSPTGVWCDAREVERAAARSDAEVLSLFGGEFLDGWHLSGLSEFGHWLEARRLRLRDLVVRAARRVAAERSADGDVARAIDALQIARALAPASDIVTRELMTLLDQQGEGTAALELYAASCAWVQREIGAGPEPATRRLADAIRARIEASAPLSPATPARADTTAAAFAVASLAVLPFANLTGDPEQEYFADGMADALITQLARLNAFRVISRQSTLRFRQSDLAVADIAAALGVDAVTEGTVSRAGDRVRVAVQLVQARPERHLWAGAYERPLKNILQMQSEIARAIAQEVSGAARTPIPDSTPTGEATVDPLAYEAYLKGRFFSAMLPEIPKAIVCFHEAIARDPGYVPALAGLAMAYANLALFVYLSPADALPEVRRAAAEALARDPGSGEAHVARGLLHLLGDWNWTAADQDFARAVALTPGAVEPHAYRALFLSAMGRNVEAGDEARRAVRLDPLGPGTRFVRALCFYKAGQHDASIADLNATLELYPQFVLALPLLAANLVHAGRDVEGSAAARHALAVLPFDQQTLAYAAATLGRAGHTKDARLALDRLLQLEREQYVDPWAIAVACCGVGDLEDALAWLRRLRERRSPSAFCVRTEPMFDVLHSRPEYRAIVEQLGFPPT
jgi:TolB-like protein